jgi:hypothetical protein
VFTRIKQTLQRLKKHEPGERFGAFYREQKDKPLGVKIAFFVLAFVSFGIGVVLAFIPGPAVLFFALTGALLSTQSRFVGDEKRWRRFVPGGAENATNRTGARRPEKRGMLGAEAPCSYRSTLQFCRCSPSA